MIKNLLLTILLLLPCIAFTQGTDSGIVMDSLTRNPIPFATVHADGQGCIADLNGHFTIKTGKTPDGKREKPLSISATGYRTCTITLNRLKKADTVWLAPATNELKEVTIRPQTDKIREILNNTLTNRNRNNPDKYKTWQCNIYYKMAVDMILPDTVKSDTAEKRRKLTEFTNKQHVLLSETYSTRTWKSPATVQEDIQAIRFSGLKRAAFTSTITDVLPFHAYTDYITLNGKDYHNPVSRGYEKYYRFSLTDEITENTGTTWVISFRPRANTANCLSGTVYISEQGYAITRIIARGIDTILGQTTSIEQEYSSHQLDDTTRRWFPSRLNYIIDKQMKSSTLSYTLRMKGNSSIDSVKWQIPDNFRFDKAHTVRIAPGADTEADTLLQQLRPAALNNREQLTYHVIDSIGQEAKADRIMQWMRHLPDGRISVGVLDADIARLLSYNQYENLRLGLGLQTNERLIKWLSVGGWGGYGFGDKAWKYGAFAEVYADKYRETVIRLSWDDDLSDPGRIQLGGSIDKGYLRQYLMQRVDNIRTAQISLRKRLGWWKAEVAAAQQEITPRYTYALAMDGIPYSSFTARQASLKIRYAPGEKTAPFFGSYYSMPGRYPVIYAKATGGELTAGHASIPYMQAIVAATWQVHINRLGMERMMIEAGRSWSDAPLPLSRLFAGNGFKYDAKTLSLYAFGGLMTMYPYDYYTDQFVQFIYRHDFDRKLFHLAHKEVPISSAPSVGLQYGMLYGTLAHREAHSGITPGVPDGDGYHEAGLLLNNLIRLQSGSMYYYSLNAGYFYHFNGEVNMEQNGKFVIGASVEF